MKGFNAKQKKPFRLCLSLCLMVMLALVPCFPSEATAPLTNEAFLKNGFARDYLESSRDITFDNVQKNRASGSVGPLEKKIYIYPSSYTDASTVSVSLYMGDGFNLNAYTYLAVHFADLQITSVNGLNITDCVFWFRSGTGEKHYVTRIGQWGAVYSEKGFFGSLLEIGVDISFSNTFTDPRFHFTFEPSSGGYITQNEGSGPGYSWFRSKNAVSPVIIKWSDVIISPQNYNNVFENKLIQQFNSLKDHISSTSGKSDALLQQQTDTIKGQTDNIMNGYDSTQGNSSLGSFNEGMGKLEDAQSSVTDSAYDKLDSFTIPTDGIGNMVAGLTASAPIVSAMLQSVFQASGDFTIIMTVTFILTIVCMLLGIAKYFVR